MYPALNPYQQNTTATPSHSTTLINPQISLKSHHGKWLCFDKAKRNYNVVADRQEPKAFETLEIIMLAGLDKILVRSPSQNRFLASNSAGQVSQSEKQTSECYWKLVMVDETHCALQALINGNYLCAERNNTVVANRPGVKNFETWEIGRQYPPISDTFDVLAKSTFHNLIGSEAICYASSGGESCLNVLTSKRKVFRSEYQREPYWQIDLRYYSQIEAISVQNSADLSEQPLLSNFWVLISNSEQFLSEQSLESAKRHAVAAFQVEPYSERTIITCKTVVGRFVRIQSALPATNLLINRIEIKGHRTSTPQGPSPQQRPQETTSSYPDITVRVANITPNFAQSGPLPDTPSQNFQPNLNQNFQPNLNQNFQPNLNQNFQPNLNQNFQPNLNQNPSFNFQQGPMPRVELQQNSFLNDFSFSGVSVNHWEASRQEFIQGRDFVIGQEEAQKKYHQWVDSLWFAPTGFKKQALDLNFGRHMIPFYLLTVHTHTNYSAEVGHEHVEHHHHKKEGQTSREVHIDWHHVSGSSATDYNKHSVCGDGDVRLNQLASKMSWDTSQIVRLDSGNLTSRGCQIHGALPQETIVNRAKKEIHSFEEQRITNILHSSDNYVRYLSLDIHYDIKRIDVLWLPAFVSSFNFEKKMHVFIVNGVNGRYDGQRPRFGLGKGGDVYKGVQNLFGTWSGSAQNTPIQVVAGSALSEKDEMEIYSPENYFLVFPRSETYLLSNNYGQLTLKNEGTCPLELLAQKRRGAQRGKNFVLQPAAEVIVAYQGEWCIEILEGYPGDLLVVSHQTSKGDPKNNNLGMA